MKKALYTLNRISRANGTGSQLLKRDLLKENDSPELRYLLQVAFDPFITTRIATVEIREKQTAEEWSFEKVKTFIGERQERKGIDAIERTLYYTMVNGFSEQHERDLMAKIITKSLNIGIGAKEINKAFGTNLIPDVVIMKAEDNPELIKKFKGKIYADLKYDGVRCWTVIKNKKVQSMKTYNFQELPIEYFAAIVDQIETVFDKTDVEYFIDGELTDFNRKAITGKINKILKGKALANIGDEILYNIFDMDRIETIKDGSGKLHYEARRDMLNQVFEVESKWVDLGEDETNVWLTSYNNGEKNQLCKNIHYQPSIECSTIGLALEAAQEWMIQGEEGAVIKDGAAVYECKRSKSWIKVKAKLECDLRIIDWFEGKEGTKRENLIGGFICESEDSGLSVKVGSGLTDEDLEWIAKHNPDSFVGRIVKVKYNMKISDKKGDFSLFLPRFDKSTSFEESLRIDKEIANYESEIK